MSLKYEPAPEPLRIYVKQLILNCGLWRQLALFALVVWQFIDGVGIWRQLMASTHVICSI